MTTKTELGEWFDRGKGTGATHMLVVCDTFDHENYPVFAMNPVECLAKYQAPGDMQRVMEVYDLNCDRDQQLEQPRVLNLPRTGD